MSSIAVILDRLQLCYMTPRVSKKFVNSTHIAPSSPPLRTSHLELPHDNSLAFSFNQSMSMLANFTLLLKYLIKDSATSIHVRILSAVAYLNFSSAMKEKTSIRKSRPIG